MKLLTLMDAGQGIQQLCSSRDVKGDVAYKCHQLNRKYREIADDVTAFEQRVIEELEMVIGPGGALIFPGQSMEDMEKVVEYRKQRAAFFEDEEVDFEFTPFKFNQIKTVSLSGNDITNLIEAGIIREPEPEPSKPKKKSKQKSKSKPALVADE